MKSIICEPRWQVIYIEYQNRIRLALRLNAISWITDDGDIYGPDGIEPLGDF